MLEHISVIMDRNGDVYLLTFLSDDDGGSWWTIASVDSVGKDYRFDLSSW